MTNNNNIKTSLKKKGGNFSVFIEKVGEFCPIVQKVAASWY